MPRTPSQRRSERQFLPILWNWIRMSSSTICEPLVVEQLEALPACATSICAHFSTMLRIAPSFSKFPRLSAHAKLPEEIVSALRLGQMTALQKANGGIRGIVVGDVIRRLVEKTLAKQHMTRFDVPPSLPNTQSRPSQGCKSMAHVVQVMTDRTQIAQCSPSVVLKLSIWCPGGP